jgi:hypothetical protein
MSISKHNQNVNSITIKASTAYTIKAPTTCTIKVSQNQREGDETLTLNPNESRLTKGTLTFGFTFIQMGWPLF